jgi:hypothetical protein
MIRLYELFIVAGVFRSIDIDMLLRVRRLSVLVLLLRGESHVLETFGGYGAVSANLRRTGLRLITLMRIRIQIFIWCGFGSGFLFDAVPDPTFHPYVDPDQDPGFQVKAQTLENFFK